MPGNVRTRIEIKGKEANKYTSLCSCEMSGDDLNAERKLTSERAWEEMKRSRGESKRDTEPLTCHSCGSCTLLSANIMLVLLFPHVGWFADETSASARRLHWLVEKSSSEHPFFWRHVAGLCVSSLVWRVVTMDADRS